jgi:hypothetical protein
MPDNIAIQNTKEIKKGQIEAQEGGVQEGKDSKEEIVFKMYEAEKRRELIQNTEDFAEAMHKRPSAPAVPVHSRADKAPAPTGQVKSEFLLQVESVLADGLGDVYARMEQELKSKFKNKGEEIAQKIETIIAQGKTRLKQILSWIREWLKMIPGVNKFFLEQEAKIKTDKILAMVAI